MWSLTEGFVDDDERRSLMRSCEAWPGLPNLKHVIIPLVSTSLAIFRYFINVVQKFKLSLLVVDLIHDSRHDVFHIIMRGNKTFSEELYAYYHHGGYRAFRKN